MFLNKKVIASLMKQAYKGAGLRVGMQDGWLYLGSDFWESWIKWEFVPKETKGDLFALLGEFPADEEFYKATKEEKQEEKFTWTDIDPGHYQHGPLMVTDTLQIGSGGTVQRFLQDPDTGKLYLINNVFMKLMDMSCIDGKNGETVPETLKYSSIGEGVIWFNNVCRFRAHFRYDSRNNKVMKQLEGVDLIPGELEEE